MGKTPEAIAGASVALAAAAAVWFTFNPAESAEKAVHQQIDGCVQVLPESFASEQARIVDSLDASCMVYAHDFDTGTGMLRLRTQSEFQAMHKDDDKQNPVMEKAAHIVYTGVAGLGSGAIAYFGIGFTRQRRSVNRQRGLIESSTAGEPIDPITESLRTRRKNLPGYLGSLPLDTQGNEQIIHDRAKRLKSKPSA